MMLAIVIAATFHSPSVGEFVTLPESAPSVVAAADSFGTPEHATNSLRITKNTRSAMASMYDGYLERCYFSAAGITNGWDVSVYGPTDPYRANFTTNFHGHWVYSRETNGFRAFPDSMRLCETRDIIASYPYMSGDIIGDLGGDALLDRGEAWKSSIRRVNFSSSLIPQAETTAFAWTGAGGVFGSFDEALIPLCALKQGDAYPLFGYGRHPEEDLTLAARLLLNACIGGTNELHTLIKSSRCNYNFVTNYLDDLIESSFNVGTNVIYPSAATARLVPDTYYVSNQWEVAHKAGWLATNSRLLAMADKTVEFPARRFDADRLDAEYQTGTARLTADASLTIYGNVKYDEEKGYTLGAYEIDPTEINLSNVTSSYNDSVSTLRGAVGFACDQFRFLGSESGAGISLVGGAAHNEFLFEIGSNFWLDTFPYGEPGSTANIGLYLRYDSSEDKVWLVANGDISWGFDIVPALQPLIVGIPIAATFTGSLSFERSYSYEQTVKPTLAKFRSAYPAFALGEAAWSRIDSSQLPKLTIFSNVLAEWADGYNQFGSVLDSLDWDYSTKTQLYSSAFSTLARKDDVWSSLYAQRDEAWKKAKTLMASKAGLSGKNLMSAASTIPVNVGLLDMSGLIEVEVGVGLDFEHSENNPLVLEVHYGPEGSVDAYKIQGFQWMSSYDPIDFYINLSAYGSISKSIPRTFDEYPSAAAQTKTSEVIETKWAWHSLQLRN